MEKLAIFVEGQTEEVFATELIYQIASRQRVHIDSVCAFGGGSAGDRVFQEVKATRRPDPHKQFYVIIYNSAGFERVLSDIRDRYDELASQSFKLIIGIRDVRPQNASEISTIRSDFEILKPKGSIIPLLVLAVMEIEAWFIAEINHFRQIDARLSASTVIAQLGYDPATFDIQLRPDPVGDLRRVYNRVGKGYTKSRQNAERTVRVLDYAYLYLSLGDRFADLANLITYLNGFFS